MLSTQFLSNGSSLYIEDNFQEALLAAPPVTLEKLIQQEAKFQDALLTETAPAIETRFQEPVSRLEAVEAELFYLYNLNIKERERIRALEQELSDLYNLGEQFYRYDHF